MKMNLQVKVRLEKQNVKVTKIKHTNGNTSPPDLKDYVANGRMIVPVEYYFTGMLAHEPIKGGTLCVYRETKMGKPCLGFFDSSTILDIKQDGDAQLISTLNSVYKVEKL